MYNVRKPVGQKELLAKGGIVKPNGMIINGENAVKPLTEEMQEKPVRVYGSNTRRGQMIGPIGRKSAAYSFYDLMMNDEDEDLRMTGFEDWIFPEFKTHRVEDGSDQFVSYMQPCRMLWRGGRDQDDGQSVLTPATAVQYLYVLLNPMKNIVSTFGSRDGMNVQKSMYMVCVEVGDPRSGKLNNAFIQYALNLNTPVHKCIQHLTTEAYIDPTDPATTKYQYLYRVIGDHDLEKEIFDRWFNSENYYFNSVLYPKIRGFMDV